MDETLTDLTEEIIVSIESLSRYIPKEKSLEFPPRKKSRVFSDKLNYILSYTKVLAQSCERQGSCKHCNIKDEKIKALSFEIEYLKSDLEEAETSMINPQQEIEVRNVYLLKAKKLLSQLNSECEHLDDCLEETNGMCEMYKRSLEAKEDAITELTTQMNILNGELNSRDVVIQDLTNNVSDLENHLNELRRELSESTQKYEKLHKFAKIKQSKLKTTHCDKETQEKIKEIEAAKSDIMINAYALLKNIHKNDEIVQLQEKEIKNLKETLEEYRKYLNEHLVYTKCTSKANIQKRRKGSLTNRPCLSARNEKKIVYISEVDSFINYLKLFIIGETSNHHLPNNLERHFYEFVRWYSTLPQFIQSNKAKRKYQKQIENVKMVNERLQDIVKGFAKNKQFLNIETVIKTLEMVYHFFCKFLKDSMAIDNYLSTSNKSKAKSCQSK